MNRSEIQAREQAALAAEKQLLKRIGTIQTELVQVGLSSFTFATDAKGKIRLNKANVRVASNLTLKIEQKAKRSFSSLLKWLFDKLKRLFGLNTRYFQAGEKTSDPILDRLMLRYGFDVATGRAIPGGYLSQVFSSANIAARVSELIYQNLAAGVTFNRFRDVFRSVFVNPGGNGLVESQFNRFSRDLFQTFDREAQNQFAQQLGLRLALYSGTAIKDTRDFCRRRWGNIYTAEEIQKWNSQQWQGKIKGVDVKVQLGGYNCRHHLSWLSEEAANRIKKEINQYNTI